MEEYGSGLFFMNSGWTGDSIAELSESLESESAEDRYVSASREAVGDKRRFLFGRQGRTKLSVRRLGG